MGGERPKRRETEIQREKEVIKEIGRLKTREERNRVAEREGSDQKNLKGDVRHVTGMVRIT